MQRQRDLMRSEWFSTMRKDFTKNESEVTATTADLEL